MATMPPSGVTEDKAQTGRTQALLHCPGRACRAGAPAVCEHKSPPVMMRRRKGGRGRRTHGDRHRLPCPCGRTAGRTSSACPLRDFQGCSPTGPGRTPGHLQWS